MAISPIGAYGAASKYNTSFTAKRNNKTTEPEQLQRSNNLRKVPVMLMMAMAPINNSASAESIMATENSAKVETVMTNPIQSEGNSYTVQASERSTDSAKIIKNLMKKQGITPKLTIFEEPFTTLDGREYTVYGVASCAKYARKGIVHKTLCVPKSMDGLFKTEQSGTLMIPYLHHIKKFESTDGKTYYLGELYANTESYGPDHALEYVLLSPEIAQYLFKKEKDCIKCYYKMPVEPERLGYKLEKGEVEVLSAAGISIDDRLTEDYWSKKYEEEREAEKAAAASAKATNKTTNPAKTSASSSTSEPKMLDTWHCSVNGDIWATFIENGKVYIKPMRNNWKMPIIHAIDLKKTSDIDALLFFSGNSNDSKEAKGVYIVRRDDAIISPVDSFIEENGKIKVLYSDIDDTKKTLTLPPSTAIRVRCIRYQEDKNKLHFSNNVRWVVSK